MTMAQLTSARQDQRLFVNQFEQERIADVGIILDARHQSNIVMENGESLFEYSVRATGALSEALLNDGNRVGLLVYGFGLERTFPGYGKVQQERIIYALGQARIGHNFDLESLGYLPTRFFPAGSQIVMVSPLLPGDFPAFTRLRATGYEVLVISPDPVELEARSKKLTGELPWKIARVERALMLRQLQRMGITSDECSSFSMRHVPAGQTRRADGGGWGSGGEGAWARPACGSR